MLLIAQIPLADARPFVGRDVRRLQRPRFDLGFDPRRADFLRSFGALEERPAGLPGDWPSEDLYCRAGRAIQIDPAALQHLKGPARGPGQFVPTMRRLLSDSDAVGRAELWLARVPRRPLRRPMTARNVESLLEAFAALPVDCRNGSGFTPATVRTMGDHLAAQVLVSTTERAAQPDGFAPQNWWVTAGRPLLMLQYAEEELSALPGAATAVPVDGRGMTLHHLKVGHELTWLIGVGPRGNTARLRELRLHLMRLHCEHEVARIVVEHCDGRLVGSKALQRYLKRTAKLIGRTKFYGHRPSATLKVAYDSTEQATAAPRVTLEQGIKRALRQCREQREASASAVAEVAPRRFPIQPR
jgi:hypothetical protein